MWNFPENIEIRENERKGRCIVAKEEIQRGESILREEAYCRILLGENKGGICDVCFSYLGLSDSLAKRAFECLECKKVRFCSEKCREELKMVHDIECGILKLDILEMISHKVGVSFDRSHLLTRFVIQAILELSGLKKIQGERNLGYLSSNLDHINTLIDNQDEYPEETKEVYRNLAFEILKIPRLQIEMDKLACKKDIISEELLVKVLCIIDSNSFGIPKFPLNSPGEASAISELLNLHQGGAPSNSLELSNSLLNPSILGWGLFSYGSLFNHSCDPNCDFIGTNSVPDNPSSAIIIDLRANRTIHKDEEITINYVELYDSRRNRIKSLFQTKHFICQCERCVASFETSMDSFLSGFVCSKCFNISDFDYKSNNIPILQSEAVSSLFELENIASVLDDQNHLISMLTETFKCNSCGEVYYGSEIACVHNEFLDTIQEAEILNSQKCDLPAAIGLISNLVDKYHCSNSRSVSPHPLSHLLYRCYKLLTFWSVIVKDWKSVDSYASKMINSHLLVFQNQCNIEISNLYSTRAIALSHLGLASESDLEWNKCISIRKSCCGSSSFPSYISSVHSLICQKFPLTCN